MTASHTAAATARPAPPHPHPHPHPHKIHIEIDRRRFEVTEPAMTGRQLKTLAGISDANQLFLEVPGHGDDLQVLDDVALELKSGMKFYDVPVGNLGAR